MTSISATSGSNYLSPLQLLQNELRTEVSSGAISSSDQSALSSALNDINSSLQNNSPSTSTGGANASPGDLKSKIDTLIAGEVSSGKLTSDQATELQGVFAAAFANGPGDSTSANNASAAGGDLAPAGPGGPGGPGGAHGGHHGGHGGPPPTGSASSSSSSGGSTSSSSGTTANDILQQFLQSLQNSLSSSSSSSYSASGSSTAGSGSSSFSALLINYQT